MDQEAKFATKFRFKDSIMSTAAQVVANIENARHSTGPRSEAGKAISSHNAMKHGLTAQTVLLPGEDEAAYLKLKTDTFASWSPINEMEGSLVQHLVDTQWRINRCARLEVLALSREVPDFKALDVISKHETRLKKTYSTTLKEAHDLIFTRINDCGRRLVDSMAVRRACQKQNVQIDLRSIGFDFSDQEVQAAIDREDAVKNAKKVLSQPQFGRF